MTTNHDDIDRRERDAEQRIRETLTRIAREQLNVPTLEARNMDRLDFHEVGVGQIERALQAAFDAGRVHAMYLTKDETTQTSANAGVCPRCGETDQEELVWLDDDRIDCQSCRTVYTIIRIA